MSPGPQLDLLHDEAPLAIVRLAADAPLPAWATQAPGFTTVTRTPDELSLVVPLQVVPPGLPAEGPFSSFHVEGRLEFGLVGILASLADPLAAAGIPIFAISTFDTDWILVPASRARAAREALAAAGHRVREA